MTQWASRTYSPKNPTLAWRYFGGFRKWWYPQIIQFNRISSINHPFWGTPIFGNTQVFWKTRWGNHKVFISSSLVVHDLRQSPGKSCPGMCDIDIWSVFFLGRISIACSLELLGLEIHRFNIFIWIPRIYHWILSLPLLPTCSFNSCLFFVVRSGPFPFL